MLTLNTRIEHADSISARLVLPYELRENSRLRTKLESGEEIAIFTERGTVLRNNDLLRGDDGRVVQIVAAEEPTYRVTCNTSHNLLRCAFHLGNRHTQTQVGENFLRIYQDSVLKEMLLGLGARRGAARPRPGDRCRWSPTALEERCEVQLRWVCGRSS